MMQKSVMSQLQTGRLYGKKWPMRKELAPLFLEFRVIRATELAITVMPILAMLTLFFQLNYLGSDFLPQAIASALFFISLPLQGLFWYNELYTKMAANGYQAQLSENKPRYMELANLLKDMFEKMDRAFTKEQF